MGITPNKKVKKERDGDNSTNGFPLKGVCVILDLYTKVRSAFFFYFFFF